MNTKIILAAALGLLIGAGGTYAFTKDDGQVIGTATAPQPQEKKDSMMAALDGKRGDAFDQAFMQQMTIHHQGAIQMAELALQNAQHPEIKQMAQDIISAQNAEIRQMQEWRTSWYGTQPAATSNDTTEPGSAVHTVQ